MNDTLKLIDKAIKSRDAALENQIEMLDTILFELKRDNPNLNLCLRGIELIKNHIKEQLELPDNLTFIKQITKIAIKDGALK